MKTVPAVILHRADLRGERVRGRVVDELEAGLMGKTLSIFFSSAMSAVVDLLTTRR